VLDILKKVVLDSNIFISAFFWKGRERNLLQKCKKGEIKLVISPFILEEVKRVLDEKFDVEKDLIQKYIKEIFKISHLVFLKGNIEEIEEDPSDNYILETAINGKAEIIVTGDKHLLNIEFYQDIRICQARDFSSMTEE
jgi:putative PIN family toxin of toxin-antitoxin system